MPNKVPENLTLEDLKYRTFATVSETAAVFKCDPKTVRSDIAAGRIPATKVGAYYRIPVAWLRAEAYKAGAA